MADKKQTMLYGLLTSIASKITYDNTASGLEADNVQDAVDEIGSKCAYIGDMVVVSSVVPAVPTTGTWVSLFSWTATCDCYVAVNMYNRGGKNCTCLLQVDGVNVCPGPMFTAGGSCPLSMIVKKGSFVDVRVYQYTEGNSLEMQSFVITELGPK